MRLLKRNIKRDFFILLIIIFLAVIGRLSFSLYELNGLIAGRFPLCKGGGSGIYARALDLRTGGVFLPKDLELELQLLQYRKRPEIDTSGSYTETGNVFTIYTRGFLFEEGRVDRKRIRVAFTDKRVSSIIDLSSGEHLNHIRLEPLRIGQLLAGNVRQNEYLSIYEASEFLVKAILAVEDRNFYKHHGVDFKAVLRAFWVNVKNGHVVQGGSTITQQLARNLFFSGEKTVNRKFDETLEAFILESRFPKQEILEGYINEIYLGQDGKQPIKGFGEAAEFYFGRNIKELELDEIALLVGMLKGPSYYNPIRFPERSKKRRDLVLRVMAQQQLISYRLANAAIEKKVSLYEHQEKVKFPAVTDLVRIHYDKYYKANQQDTMTAPGQDVRIFTTCNPVTQLRVEEGISAGFKKIERERNVKVDDLEVGVVVVAIPSNTLLAIVGGRNFRFDGFNRAIDAKRPVGSLIKPAYFLAALEQPEQYNFMTPLDNSSFNLELESGGNWAPRNYEPGQEGDVPLYKALAHSYNIASVRLGMALGLERCIENIHKLGYEKKIQPYPSLLLGSIAMSPLEVTRMYHTFASGGFSIPTKIIRGALESGHSVVNRFPIERERRFGQDAVYLLNKILQKAVSEGTVGERNQGKIKELQAAGKTGTSDDFRDSWFAGFSGNKLAVVWVGKDNNEPVSLTGAQGAFVIWEEIMNRISDIPVSPELPENIKWVKVDPYTGFEIEEQACEIAEAIPYVSGFTPEQTISCQDAKRNIQDKRPFNQWLEEVFN